MTPLQTKLDAARKLAADTRERAAAELLAVDKVLEAITKAAADGLNTITIRPTRPHDLSGTRAAAELAKQLKTANVSCEWRQRQWGADGPTAPDLTIVW